MRFCVVFISICIIAGLISVVFPYIERFTYYTPSIVYMTSFQGAHTNTAPLLNALLKKFSTYFPSEPSPPLFNSSSYPFLFSDSKTLNLLLVANTIPTNNSASPYSSKLSYQTTELQGLLGTSHESLAWNFLWEVDIPGVVYGLTASGEDLLAVYRKQNEEVVVHVLRYFANRTEGIWEDFELPGSLPLLGMTIDQDLIAYSREGDTRTFRTLERINGSWTHSQNGEFHDREKFRVSEVTGLKIIRVKNLRFLARSTAKKHTQDYAFFETDFLLQNSTTKDWKLFEDFGYKIPLPDLWTHVSGSEIMEPPKIKTSQEDSQMYIGHMGEVISAVNFT